MISTHASCCWVTSARTDPPASSIGYSANRPYATSKSNPAYTRLTWVRVRVRVRVRAKVMVRAKVRVAG